MRPPLPISFARRSPRSGTRARRREGGGGGGGAFTLIELVLVLVVLCVIMALAVPQLRGFLTGAAARDAATQLVALARYARAKAASDALTYRLTFAGDQYWLAVDAADGTGALTTTGNDFGQVFTLPQGMSLSVEPIASSSSGAPSGGASADGIDFRPDGTTDPAVIRLTDAAGVQTLIAAPAPTAPYRVMTAEEVDDL